MSVSQHPLAHRLATHVGTPTRLLATVMGLPLIDGIFPALILSGALDTVADALQVGLLIFGGSAMVTVVLTELHGSRRQNLCRVALVGAVLIPLAALEAALAPTLATLLDTAIFTRFAALVVFAIAAKTTSATLGDWLPTPGTIVGLGLLASLHPTGASLQLVTDMTLVVHAIVAASVSVGFTAITVVFRERLLAIVDIDRFRFGGGVSLGLIGLSIFGVTPANAAVSVFAVSFLLAIDTPPAGDTDAGEASNR